jgi:hypothetical protein
MPQDVIDEKMNSRAMTTHLLIVLDFPNIILKRLEIFDLHAAMRATLGAYLEGIFPSICSSRFQLGDIVHASEEFMNIGPILPPAFPSILLL